jgi:cell division protein FtsN
MAATPRRRKTAVRRKKTAARTTGAGSRRKLPNWSLLVLGLAIGLLLAWLVQLVVNGVRTPDSGLNNLITKSRTQKPSLPNKPATKPLNAKPTYDFYTILPETETPIAERDWAKQKSVATEQNVRYMLQAASYSDYKDADRLKAKLILNGLLATIEKVTIDGKGTFHRVRIGPFTSTADVDRAREQLANLGIKPMLLKLAAKKR